MRERILSICLFLLAGITIWAITAELPKKEYATPSSSTRDSIDGVASKGGESSSPAVAGEVIRLHILADSDNETDQAVKLAVRDALLPYFNAATLTATTKEEALAALTEQCETFQNVANTVLQQFGMNYTASVSIESLYFPIRLYGSQTYLSEDAIIFPPGYYDSIQVILGKGMGHNWWCLAFPSLCFIDASYDYIPTDSDLYKQKVATVEKSTLDELFYGKTANAASIDTEPMQQTYEELLQESTELSDTKEDTEVTIYFGSKLWELLKELLS